MPYPNTPNALVRTVAPSLPGGAPALSSRDGISSVMHEHGYTTREVLDWLIARAAAGGATLADGDYGDITVSGGGTVMTVDSPGTGSSSFSRSFALMGA